MLAIAFFSVVDDEGKKTNMSIRSDLDLMGHVGVPYLIFLCPFVWEI